MPVLSFPCVIHRLGNGSRPARRRVWIKGHDLWTLALAATRQLGATPDQCRYALVSPETKAATASAFLEVAYADSDALVGPMAGPLPPPAMPKDCQLSLDTLLAVLGFDQPGGGNFAGSGSGSESDSDSHCLRQYTVIVTYSPIWQRHPFPPVRQDNETDAQYGQRFDAAEQIRIERTRHQGIHLVRYDTPSKTWTAHDLEMLMVMAYRLLPTNEPRWRESGAITQAKFVNPREGHRVTLAYCLQVGRGDYVAHLRLPAFPMHALAEWLASRHFDINLRHPVMKLELVARGWRCVDGPRVGQGRRSTDDELTACPV